MKERWWKVTVALWCAAIMSFVIPGLADAAAIDVGSLRFSVSDGILILAVGAAYGDMREWRKSVEKRLEKLEE